MNVYARASLSPDLSWMIVFGITIALVANIVICLVRAVARSRMARIAAAQASDKPPPLVEGSDVLLAGIVQHFENHDVAVKVVITQDGDENESSGSWSHSWTEINREIILAPFLLELANGEKVRVDPPKNVEVADALDQKVWINRNKRVLTAELVPGEKIYARGRLERSDQAVAGSAYRDNSWGWALRATGGSQMLLSSEPLGAGMTKRAAFHRRSAWGTLVFLVGIQLSLLGFWTRMLFGHVERATVVSKHDQTGRDSDGDEYTEYFLSIRVDNVEVSEDDFERVRAGTELPIRVVSRDSWSLGPRATINWWHALIIIPIALCVLIAYPLRRKATRPWFRRKVNESGSGRLPDPPNC